MPIDKLRRESTANTVSDLWNELVEAS